MKVLVVLLVLSFAGSVQADDRQWSESGAYQCAHGHNARLGQKGDFHGKNAKRHLVPDRSVDFTHLQADLEIDPVKGTVSGTVTHHFTALGRELREVILHAGQEIRIESVQDNEGKDLPFTHALQELRISLSKALAAGQKSSLRLRYKTRPSDGLNFVHALVGGKRIREAWTQGETTFTRFWIPIWDYPNDRFTTDITTRVPAAYRVIGNGELVSESVEGKTRVRRFKMAQSHVAYLLSLCVGQFIEIKDESGPVALWFVIYPEDREHLPNTLRRSAEVLKVLGTLAGHPYPYAKYSQTVASEYPIGGMENVSATTLKRNRVNYNKSAALVYDVTGLVAHEAAHQWFGNTVTCRDWAHIWLNEGFATYFTALFFERSDGKAAGMSTLLRMRDWYMGETAKYTRPLVTYMMDNPGSMFDAHTYAKGAWVLHMLRHKMGDKLFFAGVALYLERHWEKVVESSDFRRVMEEVSGLSLAAFFAQWVYRAGHPNLSAKVVVQSKQDRIVIDFTQRTKKPFDLQLAVRVTGRSGSKDWPVRLHRSTHRLEIPISDAPHTIEIDPEGNLLAELRLDIRPTWLVKQLQNGTTAWSRTQAARALSHLESNKAAVAALMEVIQNTKEATMVRVAAAKSLGEIGTPGAYDALITTVHTAMARVRHAVLKALDECKKAGAQPALLKTVTHDASVHVRGAALAALGNFPSKGNRALLEQHLTKASWNALISAGAAKGIAKIGDNWAFKTLESLIADSSQSIERRLAVFKAFGDMAKGKKRAKERVLATVRKMAADSNHFMIREALKMLQRMGGPEDAPLLEDGFERLPKKWTHKVAHKWRRALNRPKAKKISPALKTLEKRMKRIQKRINALKKKGKTTR